MMNFGDHNSNGEYDRLYSMAEKTDGSKRAIEKPYSNNRTLMWVIAAVIVFALIIGFCFGGVGCKAINPFNPGTWFHDNPVKPKPPADDTGSFAALLQFAKWAYAPGLAIVAISVLAGIASAWFPPLKVLSDLWRLGMTLLILGLGVAALPWALQNFGQPAIWITLAFAVVVGALWLWGRRKKIMKGDFK